MELTVKDVARILGVAEDVVYRWIRESNLPHCRIQDHYRFNRVDILEWAAARGHEPTPQALTERQPVEVPRLADVVLAGGITYAIPGRTKQDVLTEVVHSIRLPASLRADDLLSVLLAREALGSTGVGDGIAIPHARNPIVARLERPLICLSFLAAPVPFGAPDGQPVHTLFTMLTPTIRMHLALLSRLSLALRQDRWRRLLVERAPRDRILATLREIEATWT